MPAYLYNAPNGIAGDITRPDETTVEPIMLQAISSVYAQAFGIPLKYVTGGAAQFATGDTAASFAGILVREVPSISGPGITGTISQGFNDGIPLPAFPQGMATKGYVAVKCTVGTPVRGGIVYVRVVAASPKNIGDLEATADGSNNVALSNTQASWATDGVDSFGNAEIRIAR